MMSSRASSRVKQGKDSTIDAKRKGKFHVTKALKLLFT